MDEHILYAWEEQIILIILHEKFTLVFSVV